MSPRGTKVARSSSTSRSAGVSQATTGVPQASASTAGRPKPSSWEATSSACAPLLRPRAGVADEHERQLARGGGELGDVPAGIGVLQLADPHQVALGQAE